MRKIGSRGKLTPETPLTPFRAALERLRSIRAQAPDRGIDAETERLMRNWARWKSGVLISLAVSGAYELEARGRREETAIPLLNGEAMDVDQAIEQLPAELKAVVVQYWTKQGTALQKARAAHCAVMTFYRRLHHAHERIRAHLRTLRDRARRDARALATA